MQGTTSTAELANKIEQGEHLAPEEYLELAREAPLEIIQRLADGMRRRHHPDHVVTYVVDRNINYSNVCTAVCTFCAFYRKPGSPEGYVLSFQQIFQKVEEMLALGGSGILMQGGLHPDLPLQWYEELLSELKRRYGIHLHCFSPPEIYAFTQLFQMTTEEVLRRLKNAGLDSIPGGGAEILVDEVRKRNTTKCNTDQWIEVMETAHRLGLPTTATMMFGLGETNAQRIEHLERLYQSQKRTGGFVAFIPWTLQPDNTKIGKRIPDRRSAEEYLRWLGIARLYLDNIPNVQVSWLTQGIEVGRQGLHFGANDLGSIMIEENVITPAGAHHRATEEVLRNAILAEGFTPCKRKADYVRLDKPS
jgi:cyclic dehypoxanthinyl futalosine synthase